MRVLVTRPAEDARRLAGLLATRGHEALVAPLMEIAMMPDAELPLAGARGLLLTSANGARALGAHDHVAAARALPVFAVGEATAAAARKAGFVGVAVADGDVESLTALVTRTLPPGAGHLVHVAGCDRAGDLAGALAARGFAAGIAVLYKVAAADRLPSDAAGALERGELDAVMLYSPRSAALYAALAAAAGLTEQARDLRHFVLSPAVANALGRLAPRRLHVAARPDQDALMALLDMPGNG